MAVILAITAERNGHPGLGREKTDEMIKEKGHGSGGEGREESLLWDVTRERKGDWNDTLN